MRRSVGIAEIKVSKDPFDILAVCSLASSVAVALYDPNARIGGVVRCGLPSSASDQEKAIELPGLYADTAISGLVEALTELGGDIAALRATLAGGSNVMGDVPVLKLGDRVSEGVRQALSRHGIVVANEEIGGTCQRDLTLRLADGRVVVRTEGVETVYA